MQGFVGNNPKSWKMEKEERLDQVSPSSGVLVLWGLMWLNRACYWFQPQDMEPLF